MCKLVIGLEIPHVQGGPIRWGSLHNPTPKCLLPLHEQGAKIQPPFISSKGPLSTPRVIDNIEIVHFFFFFLFFNALFPPQEALREVDESYLEKKRKNIISKLVMDAPRKDFMSLRDELTHNTMNFRVSFNFVPKLFEKFHFLRTLKGVYVILYITIQKIKIVYTIYFTSRNIAKIIT